MAMNENIAVKTAICMWCHNHCSVGVHIQDGRLVKVKENQHHPSAEFMKRVVRSCPRAIAAAEWFHHPDRLNYPLKRIGKRGEGKWQQIPWEQALDEIAAKLKGVSDKYGPEAVATSSGTARTHDEYRCRFFNIFGSPNNIGQGNICFGPANMVSTAIIGWSAIHTGLRPGLTKCILILGANPEQASRAVWYAALETQKSGAKLIVVDPRRSATAERADLWLQLRPGTDTALLMGMINIIINEELYDKEFVQKWCHGFRELTERVNGYSLEKVADITRVSVDQICQAARLYATSKPATSLSQMGLEHLANSIEALHCRFILPAITGNIDIRGGDPFRIPIPKFISEAEVELNDKLAPAQKKKALGAERFRLMSWPGYDMIAQNTKRLWGKQLCRAHNCFAHGPTVFRAMITGKPYPVKAMITLSSNPMVTFANTRLVYEALKNSELYVVMDFWMTPSAELADYVLPAASWIERPTIWTFNDTMSSLEAGEAAMPPRVEGKYERRTDYEFWRGLGIRLGQGEHWPWETLEEAYDYRLAPLGYTLKGLIAQKGGHESLPVEYKKHEKVGFATPTGKIELYSTIFEKLGYDPLPSFKEPPEGPVSTPDLAKEYPLILTTGGRFQPMYHSEHRQIPSLRRQHPYPIVQMNPKTAAELGIKDSDWVWIETPRGTVRQKCRLFEGIDPKVVHAEHGWWFPELPGKEPWLHGVWEANIDVLTDDEPDHCNLLSGGWPLRAGLCKVYRMETF